MEWEETGTAWRDGPPVPGPRPPIMELKGACNSKLNTSLPGCYAGVSVKVGGQNVLYLAVPPLDL